MLKEISKILETKTCTAEKQIAAKVGVSAAGVKICLK